MDPGREMFRRFVEGGEAELLAQLQSPDAENDYVDFKESDSRAERLPNGLAESDRANLAEVISGFYNTAGGVVVWGIKCRDDEDPAGRRCEPGLVDADALLAALQRKIHEVVRPAVSGMDFASVALANGRGALVMYVPPRDGRMPVEANIKQKRGYYFRAGTSFLGIPPDILAGMMGARPPSRLKPVIVPTNDRGRPILDLLVRNEGRGMGFHAYLLVEWFDAHLESKPPLNKAHDDILAFDMGDHGRYLLGGSGLRVPPGAVATMGRLTIPIYKGGLRLRFQAGAEHDLPSYLDFNFPGQPFERFRSRAGDMSSRQIWEELVSGGTMEAG